MAEAEERTEIRHQQVSKWRRRLKGIEKYKAMLYGAAYHKAMSPIMDIGFPSKMPNT